MNIKTRDFGNISAKESDVIKFADGIYGFEQYREYVILNDNPEDDIMYLQSVEKEDLSFVIIDPYSIIPMFEPNVNKEDLKELNAKSENELKFLVIAIIKEKIQDSVVNLKSPIAINPELKTAKQVILENTEYSLRYPVFNNEEDLKC